jgi:hypothetical protein
LRSRYNGGSFACGEAPRWNVSMMSMPPPQQRHGCGSSASSARRRSFADWEQWNIRERLRGTREFKDLGLADFRTKPERQLRDAAYAQERNCVSSTSFRYRVEVNYRDAIYLAYGTSVPDLLSEFIDDLFGRTHHFATMAGAYASMRVGKAAWNDFVDDLAKKRSITVSSKDIW